MPPLPPFKKDFCKLKNHLGHPLPLLGLDYSLVMGDKGRKLERLKETWQFYQAHCSPLHTVDHLPVSNTITADVQQGQV